MQEVIHVDHQREVVGNAELARDFQAGAGRREIAHAAINAGGAVEPDAASLEGAVAHNLAALVGPRLGSFVQFGVHIDPPSIPASSVPFPHNLAVRSVRHIDQHQDYTPSGLSDGETDYRNTGDFVAIC